MNILFVSSLLSSCPYWHDSAENRKSSTCGSVNLCQEPWEIERSTDWKHPDQDILLKHTSLSSLSSFCSCRCSRYLSDYIRSAEQSLPCRWGHMWESLRSRLLVWDFHSHLQTARCKLRTQRLAPETKKDCRTACWQGGKARFAVNTPTKNIAESWKQNQTYQEHENVERRQSPCSRTILAFFQTP